MGGSSQHFFQGDFSAGILSPRLYARKDLESFRRGVADSLNMWPTLEGNMERRRSMAFIEDFGPGEEGRVFPWLFSDQASALILMSATTILVHTEGSISTREQLIQNHEFTDGLRHWVNDRASVRDGRVIVRTWATGLTSHGYVEQAQTLIVPSDRVTLSVSLVLGVETGTGQPASSGFAGVDLKVYHTAIAPGNLLYDESVVATSSLELVTRLVDLPLPNAGWTGPLLVRAESIADAVTDPVDYSVLTMGNLGLEYTIAASVPPTFPSPYSEDELREIQFVQNPFEAQMVFVHQNHAPKELVLVASVWTFQDIAFNSPPAFVDGFPRSVGAHHGRLLLASSPGLPQTVWGSAPGDWREFMPGSGQGDRIEFSLTKVGALQWIYGQKELVIGSSSAEHQAISAALLLAPGDVQVEEQSSYGSRHVQAIGAGHQIIYVTVDGSAIRSLDLQNDNRGWVTGNLSVTIDHLAASRFRRVTYGVHPQPMIWAINDAGELLSMVYDPGAGGYGWSRHSTPFGQVLDICHVQFGGVDETVLLMRRDTVTGPHIYLESLANPARRSTRSIQSHLDSSIVRTYETPTAVIDGLEHLNGAVVTAMSVELGMYEDLIVAGGQTTAPVASTGWTVGLPFLSRVVTLPLATKDTGRVGHGSEKSFGPIGLRLLDSWPASVKVLDAGTAQRQPDVLSPNTVVEAGSVLYKYQGLGYTDTAQLRIDSDSARPMTIQAWYGKVEVMDD